MENTGTQTYMNFDKNVFTYIHTGMFCEDQQELGFFTDSTDSYVADISEVW
jgi:hypothetical protein